MLIPAVLLLYQGTGTGRGGGGGVAGKRSRSGRSARASPPHKAPRIVDEWGPASVMGLKPTVPPAVATGNEQQLLFNLRAHAGEATRNFLVMEVGP